MFFMLYHFNPKMSHQRKMIHFRLKMIHLLYMVSRLFPYRSTALLLHIQSFELLQFFYGNQLVEFVTGTYFHRFHREMLSFLHGLHGFQINARLVQSDEFGTRRGT